jgi:hypothetical protein
VALGLTTAIGEAILGLAQFVWPSALTDVKELGEIVADAVRPDPPLTLQTPDGQVVTGLVVLDRGRALLFFGVRQAPTAKPAYQAPERHFPEHGYPERRYDDDQPLWSSSQYGR